MKARNELNYNLFIQKTNDINRLPLNEEENKYISVYTGNINEVNHTSLISDERIFSENDFKNAVYHFIIAVWEISKGCISNGMSHDESYTLADIYIRKTDNCTKTQEIISLYSDIKLDFAKRMQEIKKENAVSLHIRKCIDYIYSHLKENLSVNSLSEYLGLNPSYLSRLFVSETGKNLKNYVIEAKIDTAENLLKFSDLSSLDISVALGFSSQSLFISTFKKVTGITPEKYREKYYISRQ